MALITNGPTALDVNGSIGGTTFARSRAGPTARSRTGPGNPATAAQSAARSALSQISKSWQLLTTAERNAWNAAANTQWRTNRLDRLYRPTGYQYYQQCNLELINRDEPLLTLPPPGPGPTPNPLAAILPQIAASTTTALVIVTKGNQNPQSLLTLATTAPTAAGRLPPPQQLRNLTTFPPSVPLTPDVSSAYVAVYGSLPTATPYNLLAQFQAIDPSTGLRLPPQRQIVIVAGPAPSPMPTPSSSCSTAPALNPGIYYEFANDTVADQWVQLTATAGTTYQLAWLQSISTSTATLSAGTSCGSLTPIANLAATDTLIFTAESGLNYYVNSTPWASSGTWALTFAERVLPWPPELLADDQAQILTTQWPASVLTRDPGPQCSCNGIVLTNDTMRYSLTTTPAAGILTGE
jgi:hypothetical protein